jgi:hypothetical protein
MAVTRVYAYMVYVDEEFDDKFNELMDEADYVVEIDFIDSYGV